MVKHQHRQYHQFLLLYCRTAFCYSCFPSLFFENGFIRRKCNQYLVIFSVLLADSLYNSVIFSAFGSQFIVITTDTIIAKVCPFTFDHLEPTKKQEVTTTTTTETLQQQVDIFTAGTGN